MLWGLTQIGISTFQCVLRKEFWGTLNETLSWLKHIAETSWQCNEMSGYHVMTKKKVKILDVFL